MRRLPGLHRLAGPWPQWLVGYTISEITTEDFGGEAYTTLMLEHDARVDDVVAISFPTHEARVHDYDEYGRPTKRDADGLRLPEPTRASRLRP